MKATVVPAIERVEKVVVEPKKIVLELSVAEAHVIFALTGAVHGSTFGPRGIADGIHEGLQEELGVSYHSSVYGNYRAECKTALTLEGTDNNYE